jgi:hypothetical protein
MIAPAALLLLAALSPSLAQQSKGIVALVCRSGGEAAFVFIDVDNRKVQAEGLDADLLMTEAYYQFTLPDKAPQRIDRTSGVRYVWNEAKRVWVGGKDSTVCEPSRARMAQ